ncbi:hypothetical protein FA13DRAFT_1712907 [Coprinellus micaceus]|uniref:Uncharacterized protein n=1 Tax=Coprinellus micaceus TaxID=71717 RepID=A0A4Y7T087_COPMI|nr:hypothetical protein FA13DRAFT_1712907 [Coprinellus micaceus]
MAREQESGVITSSRIQGRECEGRNVRRLSRVECVYGVRKGGSREVGQWCARALLGACCRPAGDARGVGRGCSRSISIAMAKGGHADWPQIRGERLVGHVEAWSVLGIRRLGSGSSQHREPQRKAQYHEVSWLRVRISKRGTTHTLACLQLFSRSKPELLAQRSWSNSPCPARSAPMHETDPRYIHDPYIGPQLLELNWRGRRLGVKWRIWGLFVLGRWMRGHPSGVHRRVYPTDINPSDFHPDHSRIHPCRSLTTSEDGAGDLPIFLKMLQSSACFGPGSKASPALPGCHLSLQLARQSPASSINTCGDGLAALFRPDALDGLPSYPVLAWSGSIEVVTATPLSCHHRYLLLHMGPPFCRARRTKELLQQVYAKGEAFTAFPLPPSGHKLEYFGIIWLYAMSWFVMVKGTENSLDLRVGSRGVRMPDSQGFILTGKELVSYASRPRSGLGLKCLIVLVPLERRFSPCCTSSQIGGDKPDHHGQRSVKNLKRGIVDRLPYDILQGIMEMCAQMDLDPDYPYSNPNAKMGNTLSHVSPSWRSVALRASQLWTVIMLDTIKPPGFWSISEAERDGVHVWSIAHAQIERVKHVSTTITIDPADARCVGVFLSRKAPLLETCTIKYIPDPDEEFAEGLCRTVLGEFNEHDSDEYNSKKLFDQFAPILHSLRLIDCHYPSTEAIFPSIEYFNTSISPENDQCDYQLRRTIEDFLVTIPLHSSLVSLTLTDAVEHMDVVSCDRLRHLPLCTLPSLRAVNFAGPLLSCSHLLRVLQPGGACSYKLSLGMEEWEDMPPAELTTCLKDIFQPIAHQSHPQTWRFALDGDGSIKLQVWSGGASYNLLFTTANWTFDISTLQDHSLWHLPSADVGLAPTNLADLAYSCVLRVLTLDHRQSLQAATKLRLDIPESNFSFRQTSRMFPLMSNVIQFGIKTCDSLSLQCIEQAFIPTHSTPVFPRLQQFYLPLVPAHQPRIVEIITHFNELRKEGPASATGFENIEAIITATQTSRRASGTFKYLFDKAPDPEAPHLRLSLDLIPGLRTSDREDRPQVNLALYHPGYYNVAVTGPMKNLQELVGPLFHGFDEDVLDEGSLPEVLNLFSVTMTCSKGGQELNVGLDDTEYILPPQAAKNDSQRFMVGDVWIYGVLRIEDPQWLSRKGQKLLEAKVRERDTNRSRLTLGQLYGRLKLRSYPDRPKVVLRLKKHLQARWGILQGARRVLFQSINNIKTMQASCYSHSQNWQHRQQMYHLLMQLGEDANPSLPPDQRTARWYIDQYRTQILPLDKRQRIIFFEGDGNTEGPGVRPISPPGAQLLSHDRHVRHVSDSELLSRFAEQCEWLLAKQIANPTSGDVHLFNMEEWVAFCRYAQRGRIDCWEKTGGVWGMPPNCNSPYDLVFEGDEFGMERFGWSKEGWTKKLVDALSHARTS